MRVRNTCNHASACIQVRDLTGTGEITKRRIKEGVGEFPVDCPLEDCAVRVHYSARLAGTDQVILATAHCQGPQTCTHAVLLLCLFCMPIQRASSHLVLQVIQQSGYQ